MRKMVFLMMIFTGLAAPVFSETATIASFSGKVEVRPPGQGWQNAEPGMVLPLNAVISTGFGAKAVIRMDNADIEVKPLTRMTIQEFATSGNTTTTTLFLGAGKIRADVKTRNNLVNDFQVRSPVATAAVRGTSFTFDGLRLEVVKGSVDFYGSRGSRVNVSQGNRSETSEEAPPAEPAEVKRQEAAVTPTTATGEEPGPAGEKAPPPLESARAGGLAPTAPTAVLEVNLR